MKCVILQPSYIPWRGYFHQIQKADVFVFLDDARYDKHGWRNRNRVKTHRGTVWLTIPVSAPGTELHQTPIHQVEIARTEPWARKHWATLRQAYGKAPFFERYADLLQGFYASDPHRLADFTIAFTQALARELGVGDTEFVRSSRLAVSGERTDRLVAILQSLGATHYITGPAARAYLEEDKLRACGIGLEYMEYDYPEYDQLYPPYDARVSVLDLLMMKGPRAPDYIWRSRP